MTVRIIQGDCREVLRGLPDESVHCVVTSPPYWGLRDYGVPGQFGQEATPEAFAEGLVAIFREVRRVIRDDGTVWLNLGDSYAGARGGAQGNSAFQDRSAARQNVRVRSVDRMAPGIKPKDLIGIPWRAALALQADGWWLRSDIIWSKPNAMPRSVRDRPTEAHEYVFLLSKSEIYHYDADAIAEPATYPEGPATASKPRPGIDHKGGNQVTRPFGAGEMRNRRSVWTITTKPFCDSHFATMPRDLAEICILAGCPKGGTVLDPFGGAGTTGLVADRLGRDATLIEINPEYCAMAERRLRSDSPLFADVVRS